MAIEKYLNKNVAIELKNGSKYFGKLIQIDDKKEYITWITLLKNNKQTDICDSEILRVEELS